MRPPRRVTLSLLFVLLGACNELPTDFASNRSPQFAGVGEPRFIEGNGSIPSRDASMLTTFKIVGLGSGASTEITATALGSALWGCMTSVDNEFNAFPGAERSEAQVAATTTFSQQNGQFSGGILLRAPKPGLQCMKPTHRLVPITTTFANVQLSHPSGATFNIQGLFDVQNYFPIFDGHPLPTITNFAPDATTFVIDGASINYTVAINNTGASRTPAVVQGWIRQGSTYRAAFGSTVICAGVERGTLPTGDCTFSLSTAASNNPVVVGNGDLVAGPAVFELHLEVGASQRVVAGVAVPITLSN